jgi:hypothetical protein
MRQQPADQQDLERTNDDAIDFQKNDAFTRACGAIVSARAKGAGSVPAWGNASGLMQQDGISAESAIHFGAESRFQRFVTQALEFLGRCPRLV